MLGALFLRLPSHSAEPYVTVVKRGMDGSTDQHDAPVLISLDASRGILIRYQLKRLSDSSVSSIDIA